MNTIIQNITSENFAIDRALLIFALSLMVFSTASLGLWFSIPMSIGLAWFLGKKETKE